MIKEKKNSYRYMKKIFSFTFNIRNKYIRKNVYCGFQIRKMTNINVYINI